MNVVTDCPGAPNDVCCVPGMDIKTGMAVCTPVQKGQEGICSNTSPGFAPEPCSAGFPLECPAQQCFVPGASGAGPGAGTKYCSDPNMTSGSPCTSGSDCCAGEACWKTSEGNLICGCTLKGSQCGPGDAPCCPGATCVPGAKDEKWPLGACE